MKLFKFGLAIPASFVLGMGVATLIDFFRIMKEARNS